MDRKRIALLLAFCEALVAVPLYGIYTAPVQLFGATEYWSPMTLMLNTLSVVFLILPLAALYGVFRNQRYGYWCLGLFPLVALVFGVTAIPFVKHLYGSAVLLNSVFIIVINTGVCLAAVWLYRTRTPK
ncbi:MAG TPA: hypothetical protein PLN31_12415 [Azoarcus taiwanensis]|nr:hypothetical protein [Azoarcus taiwanensis]